MADKGPVDWKAAVFALCVAVFLGVLVYAIIHSTIDYRGVTPAVSGSEPSPMTRPEDTPQQK